MLEKNKGILIGMMGSLLSADGVLINISDILINLWGNKNENAFF